MCYLCTRKFFPIEKLCSLAHSLFHAFISLLALTPWYSTQTRLRWCLLIAHTAIQTFIRIRRRQRRRMGKTHREIIVGKTARAIRAQMKKKTVTTTKTTTAVVTKAAAVVVAACERTKKSKASGKRRVCTTKTPRETLSGDHSKTVRIHIPIHTMCIVFSVAPISELYP